MNRLENETSPYLRQHADNPVHWYPWGDEALARARDEQRPILLSVGYAACHWCHVMAHESFEDPATAELMNRHFVNVKVDREERPDVDGIYMQALQAMTGHGGWPMTVFLTPEGVPFYAGTYFPPDDRHGMPSFRRILTAVAEAWEERRDDVEQTVASMRSLFAAGQEEARSSGPLGGPLFDRAMSTLVRQHDTRNGGFGRAPKFPSTMALDFCLRRWWRTGEDAALEIVTRTFSRMARGGIHDQVGGGFARYTVDAAWLVPHFEKMLYDNALLVRLAVHLWQATHDEEAQRVARGTLEWLQREMTSPEGGFYASLDADSEGHEGKFYVWTPAEIDAAVGVHAGIVRDYYGVTDEGNFEGRNILHVAHEPAQVAARHEITEERLDEIVGSARVRLLAVRARRVRPDTDDKILASWNGLMVRAIAEAARAFDDPDLEGLALNAGTFLLRSMTRPASDGADAGTLRVWRSFKDGEARIPGFLEDHAAVGLAFLALHELTLDHAWLERARQLADACIAHFWDDATASFHDSADDAEQLVVRPRDPTDNATPSGTSLATELLARLAEVYADADYRRRATFVVESLAEPMAQHPTAFGHLLGVAELLTFGAVELALVGDPARDDTRALQRAAASLYTAPLVMAGGAERADVALLEGRAAVGGRATAYVCRNYTCDVPAQEPEVLRAQLAATGRRSP